MMLQGFIHHPTGGWFGLGISFFHQLQYVEIARFRAPSLLGINLRRSQPWLRCCLSGGAFGSPVHTGQPTWADELRPRPQLEVSTVSCWSSFPGGCLDVGWNLKCPTLTPEIIGLNILRDAVWKKELNSRRRKQKVVGAWPKKVGCELIVPTSLCPPFLRVEFSDSTPWFHEGKLQHKNPCRFRRASSASIGWY